VETRPQSASSVRFGLFEVFPDSGELLRQGRKVKLQELPFRLLVALLEYPGEVVSRETLRQRLWPGDTFVEFDQSLGTAITKLRRALDDDAENPRFIETIPKRGYRFLAPVSHAAGGTNGSAAETSSFSTPPPSVVGAPQSVSFPALVQRSRRGALRILLPAAVVLILGSLAAYAYHVHNAFHFTPQGSVVLADFFNTTGDPVFDDSLRQGLEVGLRQSPLINILPDRKAALTLKQMGYPVEQRMTGSTAIEVCKRNGALVTVQGSISSLGTTYLIDLAAIRCDNEKLIANEEVEANRKEDVIGALGRVSSQLRARLGESLPSIQKYNAPLEQATTSSLDALNAYSTGLATWDLRGDRDSLPFFQKAIDIDPKFAMAYSALSTIYHNLGETELARKASVEAYQLRDRVTESEKASIEARYFLYVTGDLEMADKVYERAMQDYPDSADALNHLGTTDLQIGRHERAEDLFRRALQLDPTRATTYANLAQVLMRLNQDQEAAAILRQAHDRNMRTDFLLQADYWLAFLQKDEGQMDRIVQQSADIPGAQSLLLSEQANTEAFRGHYDRADSLSRQAADMMQHESDADSAAICLAQAAVRDTQIGASARARSFLQQAAKLSKADDVIVLTALATALSGDSRHALSTAAGLDKEYPSGTLVQKFWLPLIEGEVELRQGQPSKAITLLSASEPSETATTDEFYVSTLYPAYARGEAYLAAGEGASALAEFQKFSDHPGMAINYPLGSLAQLGVARSYAKMKDVKKARAAYQDFFQLWKDADPNLPALLQAKKEFRELR
jgi:eukaryotic-like serine/threonine-protein kinase